MAKVNTRMFDAVPPNDLGTAEIGLAATILCYADKYGLEMTGYRRLGDGRQVEFYFAQRNDAQRSVLGQIMTAWAQRQTAVEPRAYDEYRRYLKAIAVKGEGDE